MRTRRAVSVSVLLGVAALNLLAACTPADDADVFETPEVPEPTPVPNCQVVWTAQNAQTGSLVDVFVIDGPEDAWIAGVNTFGAFTAFYQPALDISGDSFPLTMLDTRGGAVVSTAGSFEIVLTLNGTDEEADIGIAQLTSATLMTIGTDGEPTGQEFGRTDGYVFDGVWSTGDPEESWDLGTGTVDLRLGTGTSATPIQLGDFGSFAVCYDASGDAVARPPHPITAAQRTLMRGR